MKPGLNCLRRKVYLMFSHMISRKIGAVVVVLSLVLFAAVPVAAAPQEEGFLTGFWSLIERWLPTFGAPQKSDAGPAIDPDIPSTVESGPGIDPNILVQDVGSSADPNGQDVGSGADPNG